MTKRPLHGVSRPNPAKPERLSEALLTAALAIATVAIIAALALILIPEVH
jgi:hypothetical protein